MSSTVATNPGKKAGRRRLLTETEERELHKLYVELNWTAQEVKDRFPALKEKGLSTVRMISARVAKEIEHQRKQKGRGSNTRPTTPDTGDSATEPPSQPV